MRPILPLLALLLLGGPSLQGQTKAFVNVNVLPMDRERVLEEHTVLVRDGRIDEVAPAHRVQLPPGAEIIECEGLYLMPGLADMHITLPSSEATEEQVKDFLRLFLANGVTVIRGMEGSPSHLQIKRRIASGSLLGPTVYAGAPPLGGRIGRDPRGAIGLMMSHRSAGYDFLPIGGDVPPLVWDSLAEEAHSRGYTFGGTIPAGIGLRRALSSGISTVEHLDGYLQEVVSDDVKERMARGESVPLRIQLEAVEGRKMRAISAHTRSSDTWVVPTLYRGEMMHGPVNVDSLLNQPEMRYVPSFISEGWILEATSRGPLPEETARLLKQVRGRILRALTMAGVGVMMGTDSPAMFNVPGFSLRNELRSMADAGLTPYEIIVTGTRNVAEYARKELLEPGNFGTVEEGNRADLVLLRRNPFDDLEALWDQEGVMLGGRWIPREEMDGWLQSMAGRFGGQVGTCP
ncbi:MAG: amidohydrolase family protein [Gemmatimonadetes bacterium]|nr:amidohydrolase family protein [Gemmatimonadota bacterium]NNM04262.1 amidohydrolase family protein [Gemmatimonadota bacterium]